MKTSIKVLIGLVVFAIAFAALWIIGSMGPPTNAPAVANSGQVDSQPSTEPPDLTGDWKQTNTASSESAMTATISGDVIEVYWNTEDSQSLYWAGSFEAPTTPDEPYTWTSNNDHEKTDSAMIASADDTKEFTYQNGELSYSASAAGTTTTVRMTKTN